MRDYFENAQARFDDEIENQQLNGLVLELLSKVNKSQICLLSEYDRNGANIVHYCAALNLHEVFSEFVARGVPITTKLNN